MCFFSWYLWQLLNKMLFCRIVGLFKPCWLTHCALCSQLYDSFTEKWGSCVPWHSPGFLSAFVLNLTSQWNAGVICFFSSPQTQFSPTLPFARKKKHRNTTGSLGGVVEEAPGGLRLLFGCSQSPLLSPRAWETLQDLGQRWRRLQACTAKDDC